MPVRRNVTIPYGDLRTELLPMLHGRAFHVTTSNALDSIIISGAVFAKPEDIPADIKIWHYDAYFRSIGCVSLCDLRAVTDDDLDLALSRYYFLDPGSQVSDPEVGDPVFLLLSKRAEASIITNEEVKEAAIGRMLVPHIEAGFPGDLPLDQIETVLSVTVHRPEDDPFVAAMKLAGQPPEQ